MAIKKIRRQGLRNEFPDDKATNEWLDAQKRSTRATYGSYWVYFLEYTGLTGDEILDSRKSDETYEWEKRTLSFKTWMIREKHLSEKSAASAGATVRSFFSFHRLPLKFRRGESRRLTEARRKYEDYRFSREDLKLMADVANLKEKYVIVVGKSFGLRAGDFLRITRGDLEPYIDREPPISIGEYPTQKEGVVAYPFIDTDAKLAIKMMLKQMDREGRTDPSERMLKYKKEIQLSRIVRRVAERAGINFGNKRVRFHCLRKFLIDRLASHMSTEKWKQIVGKKISEGAYVSPDSLRQDYARAMSETCWSYEKINEDELRIKAALDTLRLTRRIPEERIKQLEKDFLKPARRREISVDEALIQLAQSIAGEFFEYHPNLIKEKTKKVVSEEQLENELNHGWNFVTVLPSGKILIEKEG